MRDGRPGAPSGAEALPGLRRHRQLAEGHGSELPALRRVRGVGAVIETKHTRYNRSEKGRARDAKRRGTLERYIQQRRSTLRVNRQKLTNRLEELNASA